ncbi:MAG: glycosyltransferase family 2 protein [Nitrospirota bacterium]|nr:glycosyltransferase family 2 protein [Nitrospirota bacterium]
MNFKKYHMSVIIPVYNGENFLAEAVESVHRQKHIPLEIIIVDDGSTDSTAKIVAGLQGNVRYVYQANSGPAAARNKGLRLASGDVIGFLDVDDVWSKDKLRLQLGYFEKDPSLEIVLGLLQRMQLTGAEGGKHTFKEWEGPVMNMHLGSALFRRSVFEKVGLLDESLGYCEDWDWFMRAKERQVPMVVHKEVVYYYRRHNHNITNDTETGLNFALKMLRYSLDRRRQQGKGQIEQLPRISDFATDHPGHPHKNKEKC